MDTFSYKGITATLEPYDDGGLFWTANINGERYGSGVSNPREIKLSQKQTQDLRKALLSQFTRTVDALMAKKETV